MTFVRLSFDEARQAMAELVERYSAHVVEIEAVGSSYTETETRTDFIDSFLSILGWDVSNVSNKSQLEREVFQERSHTESSMAVGRPDYRLRIGGRDRIPVEAKRPSVSLLTHAASARQTRSYGWTMSRPAAVLTNMSQTVIYDTTVSPEQYDGPDVAVLPGCRFYYYEYVSRFGELWKYLSYESVSTDDFYKVYDYSEPRRGTSPFDITFLADFQQWRLTLATNVAALNPLLSILEIGRRVQRVLNALLFLRVCEDRDIASYEGLLRSAKAKKVIEKFRESDLAFNAGLFDVLDDTLVDNEALLAVIREMYWPRTKFAFGVLDADILASIYEQYLELKVEAAEDGAIRLVHKPEIAHAGGIVPTPIYIVETLVDSALASLESHNEIPSTFSILDPSCGSGTFLLTALTRLIQIAENTSCQTVGLKRRAELASRHLHGLDIDGEAVEVSRLSVLLLVLGDELVDLKMVRHLLPDLAANIQVGNFLVHEDFDVINPIAASDPSRRAAVAPSNVEVMFADVLARGGFDAIIGNPPYIRIQVLAAYLSDQLSYFQDERSGLIGAKSGSFDTYMLFVERSMKLLAQQGRLAFIVPNRFMNAQPAAHMRLLLGPRLERLVHFGELQVFPGRSTYTSLILVGPATEVAATFEMVKDLDSWRNGETGDLKLVEREALFAQPWPTSTAAQELIFVAMEDAAIAHLGDTGWVHIFVGIQTSADDIFFVKIDESRSSEDLASFLDSNQKRWQIERGLLKPAIRDRRIEPFDYAPKPDYHAIFPYVRDAQSSKMRRLTLREMRNLYPRTLDYLEANRVRLSPPLRSVSPPAGGEFFAYGRSQSLNLLGDPKIIVRTLSTMPRYAIDDSGLLVPGGGDGGPYYLLRPRPECPYSLEVLQAILSHPAVDAFIASRGKAYRGSYVVHRKAFLQAVPVPRLSQQHQEAIEEHIRELRGNRSLLASDTDSALRSSLLAREVYLRGRIEALVTASFNLSESAVAEITGS